MAKRKPYQDRAGSKVQSQAWSQEAKFVGRFQRAFVETMRSLYEDKKTQRELARIIRTSRSPEAAAKAVEALFDTEKLTARFEKIYVDVMEAAGEAEFKRLKVPGKFQVVAKALEGIPVNRFSAKWINERTGDLIKEITSAEKKRVRQVVMRNFGKRMTTPDVAAELGNTVGLLASEEARVQAAFDAALEKGTPRVVARAQSKEVANRLLFQRGKRIARTETIMAQNQGKLDSWKQAADEGIMPPGTMKTWIAATDSERTCKICGSEDGGLDRMSVPVNEPFESEYVGLLDRPPAHPNCRCTMTLSFPET